LQAEEAKSLTLKNWGLSSLNLKTSVSIEENNALLWAKSRYLKPSPIMKWMRN
jgi:hypothetical protein